MVIGDLIILALTCRAAVEKTRDKLLTKAKQTAEKNRLFNYGQCKGQITDENAWQHPRS